MSLAADTREAVRERPVLYDALRAGVVNYTAAAETLDIDGDREAIATALRRFTESLSENADEPTDRSLTVRMDRSVDPDELDAVPSTVETAGVDDAVTAVRARGGVDAEMLATVCDRLRIAEIDILAASVAADLLVVVVPQRAGVDTLRTVEAVA
jgi:hypothetical protein